MSGLENGVGYDVQVRAVNAVGDGAWSSTRRGTPAIQNQAPFFAVETLAHEVSESVEVGAAIGSPIAATDPDGDALTYIIPGGHDLFRVDENTGHLRTKATLDADAGVTSHSFFVEVTDALNSSDEEDPAIDDNIDVMINVTDVDEPPEIEIASAGSGVTASGSQLTVQEHHAGPVATFAANDPENDQTLTHEWSLGGIEASGFAITGAGVLSFAAIPDYERPADSSGNNVYDITVSALDSDGKTDSIDAPQCLPVELLEGLEVREPRLAQQARHRPPADAGIPRRAVAAGQPPSSSCSRNSS